MRMYSHEDDDGKSKGRRLRAAAKATDLADVCSMDTGRSYLLPSVMTPFTMR